MRAFNINDINSKTIHVQTQAKTDHPYPVLHGANSQPPFAIKGGTERATMSNKKPSFSTAAIAIRIDAVMSATVKGASRALKEGVRRANTDPAKAAGHMMEVMHTSTFNIDAALKGTGTDAVMTADLGRHTDKVDIIVRRKGDVLNVQAKNTVSDSTATLVRRTGDAKYSGCDQILVPEDKLGGLQDYAKGRLEKPSTNPNAPITAEGHKQIVEKATDRIEFKGTASKPMTGQKAKVYAENPGSAAKDLYMHGASRAVALGAGAGAFAACVSAATSKEQDPMKRAKEAGVVGLTVAGCSIATAAGTAALKALGRHGGQVFRPLVRGNVAAAVIEGGVCISNESYRYYKGECSGTEAFDHIAEKGSSMLGGFAAVTATGLALAALPAAPFLVATVAVTGLGIGGSLGGSYIYKAGKRFFGK